MTLLKKWRRQGYDTGILSEEDIEATVALLRNANRHISEKLFDQLLDKISQL